MLRWGFPASWDEGFVQTNARAETIASSKMFNQAFEKRSCLVPADGFFEWLRVSEKDKLELDIVTAAKLEEFATPYPASEMHAVPVSKRANNVRNKSPDILMPDLEQPTLF